MGGDALKEGLVPTVTTLCFPNSGVNHPGLFGGVVYYLNCLGGM